MTLAPQEQTIVAPDGQPHTDSHGASMIVPADILEEAAHVELIASSAQGTLANALSQDFTIETPFYAIVGNCLPFYGKCGKLSPWLSNCRK